METQARGTDWRSLLLLIFSLGSSFFVLSVAAVLLGMFIFNKSTLNVSASLTNILGATTLVAIGVLLLPAGVLSWQRLRGRAFKSIHLPVMPPWVWGGIPLLWVIVLALANSYYETPLAAWYIPGLHFLAVVLPIYFIIRIGLHSIPLGSIQRVWAMLTSGYSISILLAIILEAILVLAAIAALGVVASLNPGIMTDMQRLAGQIDRARDIESLLPIVAPLLKNPLTLVAALSFLSLFVPIVEELAKSVGVWLVADRLDSPAQGFAMGFLCGAGFALAESLSATLTPDVTWAVSFMTRALSSSMHMMASGLIGLGIAYMRLEKRYFRLAGLTLLAMLLHGSWNAGAILTVAGGLRATLAAPAIDYPGVFLGLVGLSILMLLIGILAVSLVLINMRLRAPSNTASPASVDLTDSSSAMRPPTPTREE
jgi:uncharacterized membrane protein YidH (DUF202 family)